ncbi:MAG: ATP-binding protein [Candidatus Binatia bacterium]
MSFIGFLIAFWLFCKYRRHWRYYRSRLGEDGNLNLGGPSAWGCGGGGGGWWDDHHRHRDRSERRERRRRREERRLEEARMRSTTSDSRAQPRDARPNEDDVLARARRRAAAEMGFYVHLMSYLGVIAFLAFLNLLTTWYPWFLWPAAGWGLGLFFHYMGVFGTHALKQRYFDPAVEREVRREKAAIVTEKQASIDDLSSTIAHEIRNPIAAAKSLVQQIGEDPTSVENVEYAKVALEELERVERRISHLLRYAKEEDYEFTHVNLASIVDSSLTQLRSKLDESKVAVARNYIGGPTVSGDGEKLLQVFTNVLDNAIDALAPVAEGRRIELFIENGRPGHATVRVRDNGSGISPEKVERIFNPFFTTKEKGTGLGMAISKKIVEAHEGTIEVASEVGRGTEFRITLPLPQRS